MPELPESESWERLPYNHDKFVNRVDEWRLVVDKARRLASNAVDDRRVVIFRGARGAGKSWSLQEIEHQLSQNPPSAPAVYVSLSEFAAWPIDESLPVIIRRVDNEVAGITHFSNLHSVNDLAGQARCLSNKVFVLLFDHVDESPDSLLVVLEDHCLSPLIVEPKVLMVLAGLGKQYVWKGPELRLKSEERTLSRFDSIQTFEQLEKQSPSSIP